MSSLLFFSAIAANVLFNSISWTPNAPGFQNVNIVLLHVKVDGVTLESGKVIAVGLLKNPSTNILESYTLAESVIDLYPPLAKFLASFTIPFNDIGTSIDFYLDDGLNKCIVAQPDWSLSDAKSFLLEVCTLINSFVNPVAFTFLANNISPLSKALTLSQCMIEDVAGTEALTVVALATHS